VVLERPVGVLPVDERFDSDTRHENVVQRHRVAGRRSRIGNRPSLSVRALRPPAVIRACPSGQVLQREPGITPQLFGNT
jgi:hypothetical protein